MRQHQGHARNHPAFWAGKRLTLTAAYDICSQDRTGKEAILIKGENRMSTLRSCLEAAPDFLIKKDDAMAIIGHQQTTLATDWAGVCEDAKLNQTDQRLLAGRQLLNSYCVEDLGADHEDLCEQFEAARAELVG